jgi:hypothetical protein
MTSFILTASCVSSEAALAPSRPPPRVRALSALLGLSMLLASCTSGPNLQEEQPRGWTGRTLAQQRYEAVPPEQASSPTGDSALRPYLDFIQDKKQELKDSSPGQQE